MTIAAVGDHYEDVFVFEDLVYAMEGQLCVVHVYRNRNISLIKLHDIRYPCKCNGRILHHDSSNHTIVVTNEQHIVQCCAIEKLVSVLDRSGDLLWAITEDSMLGPGLQQVDVEGNFVTYDIFSQCLLIANANLPASQSLVIKDLGYFLGHCRIYFRRLSVVVYLVRVRLYSFAHSCLYLAVRFSLRLCLSVN